jgi:hypothetical protein
VLDTDNDFFRRRENYVLNGIPAAVYAFHIHSARRERNHALGQVAQACGRWLRGLVRFAPDTLPARTGR